MQNGTAVEQRHERGWFVGADGTWRAYDGFDAEPLLQVRPAERAATPQLHARLSALLDDVAPPIRVVA